MPKWIKGWSFEAAPMPSSEIHVGGLFSYYFHILILGLQPHQIHPTFGVFLGQNPSQWHSGSHCNNSCTFLAPSLRRLPGLYVAEWASGCHQVQYLQYNTSACLPDRITQWAA